MTAKDAPRGERNMFQAGNTESQKGGFVRQKMARWRKENPDAPMTAAEADKELRAALRETLPDRLDAMVKVAVDDTHKDFSRIAPVLLEHDWGKPKQSVDVAMDAVITVIGGLPEMPRENAGNIPPDISSGAS